MKHKRQTLSKDDPEIKDSKSKSESSLNEDKSGGSREAHAVKEEDGGAVKKEELSDQENSESISSIPDSEDGGERGEGEPEGSDPRARLGGRAIHSPLSSPPGGLSGPPGHLSGPQSHLSGPPNHLSGPPGHLPGPPNHLSGPPGHPRAREIGGLPITATMGKSKLTSLANLSPTPKSLLTGNFPSCWC